MTIRLVSLSSRFLLFFFLVATASSGVFASNGGMKIERTLAMIKPDGLRGNFTDRIKGAIVGSGFRILEERIVELDEDRASRFYAEHSSKSFFFSLVKYMTSGPVCIMVLEKQNAIADWRALIGPTDAVKAKATHPNSIRAMCGLDSEKNCVHGSDSLLSAQREISFFFGEETGEMVGKHDEL
ncbi:probable nucleoside diphosphate kinase 5 isoform X2 [Benincasa hispida]|nr:probable nucleoside diphosphate kinase 5 isoform X2 [Benincasa hispida]